MTTPDLSLDGIPRWARWVLSILVILGTAYEWARPAEPGKPQQALIVELLVYAALFVLSELLRPKPKIEDARPGTVFNFPTATEGRVVPLVWGRVMMDGPNVVWYGDVEQEAITERVKTGLFSSTRIVKGYRYHVGVQFALCRGPIDGIRRVWVGENLIYDGGLATTEIDVDAPDLFGGDDTGNGGLRATMDIFLGSTTQAVSAYLAQHQDSGAGTDRTPRYSGTAHLVFRELDVAAGSARGGYIGNSTSVLPFKFEVERYPAGFSGQTGTQNKVGDDANPINVIYELLTNVEWGFGFPAADVDVGVGSSFLDASDTMIAEANGFSMVLDSPVTAEDFKRELERQIGGLVYLDHRSGKWKVKLARADYDVDLVPQLSPSNVRAMQDFSRGSWEDTTNQIVVKFRHRDNDYKESYALAQDMANGLILGGGTVNTVQMTAAEVHYPGVSNPTLAGTLAWRDLRTQSYPLARATLIVGRDSWDVTIGDVVAWTDPDLGFEKLPMRVTGVDYGRLDQNEIQLRVIQDVFQFTAGGYASPPPSLWTPPVTGLVAYPSSDQLAIEAPRAVVVRDPLYNGNEYAARILCAARKQGNETGFEIHTRYYSPPGSPSGTYEQTGLVLGFMRIGKLSGALPMAAANPTATVTVEPDPDSQTVIRTQFLATTTLQDMGQSLANLIMVGNEFMLVTSAANNGANVDLQGVYRGALDSAQESHADDSPVYLLFTGAGLPEAVFPATGIGIQAELRMTGLTGTFAGAATAITVTPAPDYRTARPYPPGAIRYNGSSTPFTTPSLEGAGSGLNGFRVDVDWWRRNHRTTDEVASLLADDPPDSSLNTEYQLEVRADPLGANTLVMTSAWTSGTGTIQVLRTAIITAAAAGTLLRFKLKARHDLVFVDHESRYSLQHDVTPTSSLTGQFYLGGGVNDNTATASYTAAATGTFTVNLGAADAADVEVSINAGAFATVVAAGLTSGTFSATSGDGIRFRRLTGGSPDPNFIELRNPSSVAVAYGTFD